MLIFHHLQGTPDKVLADFEDVDLDSKNTSEGEEDEEEGKDEEGKDNDKEVLGNSRFFLHL